MSLSPKTTEVLSDCGCKRVYAIVLQQLNVMLVLQPDCNRTVEIITPRVFRGRGLSARRPAVNWVQRLFNCCWVDTLIAYVNIYLPNSKDVSSHFVFLFLVISSAWRGDDDGFVVTRVRLVRSTVFGKNNFFWGPVIKNITCLFLSR